MKKYNIRDEINRRLDQFERDIATDAILPTDRQRIEPILSLIRNSADRFDLTRGVNLREEPIEKSYIDLVAEMKRLINPLFRENKVDYNLVYSLLDELAEILWKYSLRR